MVALGLAGGCTCNDHLGAEGAASPSSVLTAKIASFP
jgi:hypothetical protein